MSRSIEEKRQQMWQRLSDDPPGHDLFALLRRIDALHPDRPRFGYAERPSQEVLRVAQEPHSTFAASNIARFNGPNGHRPAQIKQNGFGLFGPNGPMPSAISDHVRERAQHHGDTALRDFADLFHHRFSLLFYRAWADAQPTVNMDQAGNNGFARYVSCLIGAGLDSHTDRDSIHDHARRHHAGHIVRQTRNAEGIERILQSYFRVPVRVEQYVRRWMALPEAQRTRLGSPRGACLGQDAVIGEKVLDRQHNIRLWIGPLSWQDYIRFLPNGKAYKQLRDWMRGYIGIELTWDVRLGLRADERPATQLGGKSRLGWSSWVATDAAKHDPFDLTLSPEEIEPTSTPDDPSNRSSTTDFQPAFDADSIPANEAMHA